ncbi:MAG TPA: hypothetical protein VK203_07535 [Nostocaceae cyanobacterium]|nr:hypothetical protein [Nostocaceae cyanobacterium]
MNKNVRSNAVEMSNQWGNLGMKFYDLHPHLSFIYISIVPLLTVLKNIYIAIKHKSHKFNFLQIGCENKLDFQPRLEFSTT